ncbi:uncharacterized protein LOC123260103 [Cotesia glomerata]|uniref:uncharacterized protein LOC123260103 n=1 Tax=Cotesia glomerata TaxID=32391 RepID=UPI001D024102|nr:uncharacterized protein LOC123260103 [Cotesia glomerata]
MTSASKTLEWLKLEIIPEVLKILNKNNDQIESISTSSNDTYALSEVNFIDIVFTNYETLNLVIKSPPLVKNHLVQFNIRQIYTNEIIFYKLFAKNALKGIPKFYYGSVKDPIEKSVIVLENVTEKGFKLCPTVFDMPFWYVISAVRELGYFHGTYYAFKERELDKFMKIVNGIKEAWFIDGNFVSNVIKTVGSRPVEWLRKIDYDDNFCKKMEHHLSDAFSTIMLDAIKPVEPLATLCHGDFTRSNMLFRRACGINGNDNDDDHDHGKEEKEKRLEVMLIDFGMMRYTSPSIDLSTFLYLSVFSEDRKNRFDEIFRAYHDALLDYLGKAGLIDLGRYSSEKMLEDYKRRAAYGFIVALYFLPVLHGLCDDPDRNNEAAVPDGREFGLIAKLAGGDAMSAVFGDMLLELRDTGCLDHLL